MNSEVNEQIDVIKKGSVEIIPEDELIKKIEHSVKSKKPLNIKLGCDPSVPDLHIGHAVVLNKLREFQEFGHNAILIVGDYTGMIGDPSGKKKTRPQLSFEETRINGLTYFEQASKILDKTKTRIVYNSEWLSQLKLEDLIRILSKFTVQRILERDDFTIRLKEQTEIAMHELLYPIMQGYDSFAVAADVELGGTDQKFNNLIGRDIQRRFGREPQVVLLMPLLEGTDGNEKMSKSLNNYIGITENPKDMFGKVMSIPDSLIYKYFLLATRISPQEIENIKKQLDEKSVNPKNLKKRLGYEIVKLYHDESKAKYAEEEFDKVFSKKELPENIDEIELKGYDHKLVNVLVSTGISDSNASARRLIQQGGVSINGEKVLDIHFVLKEKKDYIIKAGKRKFLKVIII